MQVLHKLKRSVLGRHAADVRALTMPKGFCCSTDDGKAEPDDRPQATRAILRPHDHAEPRAAGSVAGKQIKRVSRRSRRASVIGLVGALVLTSVASAQESGEQESNSGKLEEVIVTAQKKAERLEDVPVSMTVVNTDALVEKNQVSLADYYASIPGLTIAPTGFGNNTVSIRGLSTGADPFVNPTVSIMVDDVPFSASTGGASGDQVPDFDPSDLERIEVLRGPQGTLYGANSFGGTIKFVTRDPSTDAVSGRVQTGIDYVQNGGQPGYVTRAAINLPLSDNVAVRASAFVRDDPGYIDNLGYEVVRPGQPPVPSGQVQMRGVNQEHVYGGSIKALWYISDAFSLILNTMRQDQHIDGWEVVNYDPSDIANLRQTAVPGAGSQHRGYEVDSATLKGAIGSANLTVVSSYSVNKLETGNDITPGLGGFTASQSMFGGVGGSLVENTSVTKKYSEEARLQMPLGDHFDWLVGVFYTHESTPYLQQILAANQSTGAIAGAGINFNSWDRYWAYSGYSDLTVKFTDKFNVQVGGREMVDRQTSYEVDTGPYTQDFDGYPPPYNYGGAVRSSDHSFTYLVTPQYRVSNNLMLYARFASGFRPGGPNGGLPVAYDVPHSYGPDKTYNYEIGVKGESANQMFSFDAAAYTIDWKNMQIGADAVVDLGGGNTSTADYTTNAGSAKSQGIELSGQAKPLNGLVVTGSFDFSNARLTSVPADAQVGSPGDRLPYAARVSAYLSAQQDFAITSWLKGFIGGGCAYMGDRAGELVNAGQPRFNLPSYYKLDLNAGIKQGNWTVNAFANNVSNQRGLLLNAYPQFVALIAPRSIGLNVWRTF
jgi:iron complex outermembrane receptor protein